MTRVMQKSQTSLNDYAKKNPEIAYATPEEDEDGDTKSDEEGSDLDKDGKESKTDKDSNTGKDSKSDKDSKNSTEITAQEIYDNFYYTDETDGYKFHLMYYTSKHELSTAELELNVEDPEETLTLFYDLFKAEHEFSSISDLQKFADKLAVPVDENQSEDEVTDTEDAESSGDK